MTLSFGSELVGSDVADSKEVISVFVVESDAGDSNAQPNVVDGKMTQIGRLIKSVNIELMAQSYSAKLYLRVFFFFGLAFACFCRNMREHAVVVYAALLFFWGFIGDLMTFLFILNHR